MAKAHRKTRRSLYLVAFILSCACLSAQSSRIAGPLAAYHISRGYGYSDSLGSDSIPVQSMYHFGEAAIQNARSDDHFFLSDMLDSCSTWHVNRVMGIINPPSEKGSYNIPADTSLYFHHPVRGSGMIQGGARFSRLSQLHGPVCGAIFDDWNFDTAITRDIYFAVHGRYVDAEGNVYRESEETTPDNRLYCVLYQTDAHPEVMPYMDGLYFSYFEGQNCCYTNLDSDIDQLRMHFPGKEIMIATFLKNSKLGWTDPASVRYMLSHSLDRYDDGDIGQVCIFAGTQFTTGVMSVARRDSLSLLPLLDTVYYPYLGVAGGHVLDCETHTPLPAAFVRVFTRGRVSGDTLFRSRQMADTAGSYLCGLWAGNRTTDSVHYWAIAQKDGYYPDTVSFWVRRGDTATIPDLNLCSGYHALPQGDFLLYPDPARGGFDLHIPAQLATDATVEVYDMDGQRVYLSTAVREYMYVDLTGRAGGVYVVSLRQSGRLVRSRRMVLQP